MNRMMHIGVSAAFGFSLAGAAMVAMSVAHAQTPTAIAIPPDVTSTLITKLLESVVGVVTLLIGTLGSFLALKWNNLLNVKDVGERQRNEVDLKNFLHDAIWSATKFALQEANITLPELQADKPAPAEMIETAVAYVKEHNPETVAKLGITDDALGQLVISKIPDLVGMLAHTIADKALAKKAGPIAAAAATAAVAAVAAAPKAKVPAAKK